MEEKELTSIEKLDEALKRINVVYFPHFETILSLQEYFKAINIEFSYKQIWQILDKLEKDGLVYIENKTDLDKLKVCATFEAEMFVKKGGYANQKFTKTYQSILLVSQTWLIVIGTLAAGIYGVFEMWKYFYGFNCPCQ